MIKSKRLKKTVKIGDKRHKKDRCSSLFLAKVYLETYIRDEDGDTIDENSELYVKPKLYTLRELIKLIDQYAGISKYRDYEINHDSAWFESDYDSDRENEEYKFIVLVDASPRALRHLQNHVDHTLGIDRKAEEQKRIQREIERQAEGEKRIQIEKLRASFQVIQGGNEFFSRPSKAKLEVAS